MKLLPSSSIPNVLPASSDPGPPSTCLGIIFALPAVSYVGRGTMPRDRR